MDSIPALKLLNENMQLILIPNIIRYNTRYWPVWEDISLSHNCKTRSNHRQEVLKSFYILHIHKNIDRHQWALFLLWHDRKPGR